MLVFLRCPLHQNFTIHFTATLTLSCLKLFNIELAQQLNKLEQVHLKILLKHPQV